jgi:hypothetical protein
MMLVGLSGTSQMFQIATNEALWAQLSFRFGRAVTVEWPTSVSPGPTKWVRGFLRVPQGFETLDFKVEVGANTLPNLALSQRTEASTLPTVYRPALNLFVKSREYPTWVDWVCGIGASAAFLLLALAWLLTTGKIERGIGKCGAPHSSGANKPILAWQSLTRSTE